MQSILNFLGDFVDWLLYVPLCWTLMVSEMIIDGTVGVMIDIVGGAGSALSEAMAGLPAGVVWAMNDVAHLPFVLPAVLGGLATRFIIRRLPIIG